MIFCSVNSWSLHKNYALHVFIGVKKCELLKYEYKDWQHTETFVAGKLMQTCMFIYCFNTFLDNKTLYLLR